MTRNLKYYASANSCAGYVSFMDEYAAACNTTIALKNVSAECMALLKEKLGDCSVILKAGTKDEAEGFFFPKSSILITGAEFLENCEITFDFQCVSQRKIDINDDCRQLYTELAEAKKIHDEWEKIYISQMDFDAAEAALKKAEQSIPDAASDKRGTNENRFFGTMLGSGSVNYINELTQGFRTRIFIKGRPGSGKSTLMQKFAETARNRGFNTESYFCSFDPSSIDMIILRNAGVCIFDATLPHELFPKFPSDKTLDLYTLCIKRGTDEKYAAEIADTAQRYAYKMDSARKFLTEINEKYAEFEKSVTFEKSRAEKLIKNIKSIVND